MAGHVANIKDARLKKSLAALEAAGIELSPTNSDIRVAAKFGIWSELTKAARRVSNTISGIDELKTFARPLAEGYGFKTTEIPIASIWFNAKFGDSVKGASRLEDVLAVEIPMIYEVRVHGYPVVFVGGPVTSFGLEHKLDYWTTLRNRTIELAYRRPGQITISTTSYGEGVEEKLAQTHGAEGHEAAQAAFKQHHRTELRIGGFKAILLTGPWGMSSGTVDEYNTAIREEIPVKDKSGDEILGRLASGIVLARRH